MFYLVSLGVHKEENGENNAENSYLPSKGRVEVRYQDSALFLDGALSLIRLSFVLTHRFSIALFQ